jgi:AcrR family transcriptional regulator
MTIKADLSKSKILAAALQLLEHDGARAISLDKVATAAGVSKGGLMHHFKSKQDLFLGLIDLVIARMKERLDDLVAQEPEGEPGRFTRAYIRCNLLTIQSGEAESMRGLLEMLLVVPTLVEKRRGEIQEMHERQNADGLDPIHSMMLASASDGCWMDVILGFMKPDDPRIVAIHEHLLAQTRKVNS